MEKEQLRKSIAIILHRLIMQESNSQVEIMGKLRTIGHPIKKATLSNLYNASPRVGHSTLFAAKKGLDILLEKLLCESFDYDKKVFHSIINCQPENIPLSVHHETSSSNFPYKIHNERLTISDKLKLYTKAQSEIIEIGIRLKSFKSYFKQRGDGKFLNPLTQRLDAGVNFKCYVADPTSARLKSYVTEISDAIKSENDITENIAKVQRELTEIMQSINQHHGPGKFQLYKYQRTPNYHVTLIDANLSTAAMYISPYLYGQLRRNSPVIEIHKKNNSQLFKNYYKSVKAFITSSDKYKIIPIIK